MKQTKRFSFIYPLTKTVVRDGRIKTIHVGDILLEGLAYKLDGKYSVDIESAKWDGSEVLGLLEWDFFDIGKSVLEDAALSHAEGLWAEQENMGEAA